MGPVTYRLKLPQGWKTHNMFHAMLLKPYTETETYGENYTRPSPELLEEQGVYEVETIVNIEEEERGINTSSSGKDIRSKKQHGNWKQISPKMETC